MAHRTAAMPVRSAKHFADSLFYTNTAGKSAMLVLAWSRGALSAKTDSDKKEKKEKETEKTKAIKTREKTK